MGATEVMVLALQHQANPVEMAEPVAMADLSATAAMGDWAAMAQAGRPEQLVRHPEIQAPMAQLAEQAVVAGQADPVEQFQASTATAVMQAMAGMGDLVGMALREPVE
jgi:hypothetical protein